MIFCILLLFIALHYIFYLILHDFVGTNQLIVFNLTGTTYN